MSHRALVGLIVALVASSGQSPVQLSAFAEAAPPAPAPTVKVELIDVEEVVPYPQGGPSVLVPATLCPNQIDWLVGLGATRVLLTVHAIDLTSQTHPELTEGEIASQHCALHRQSQSILVPRELCEVGHTARWDPGASFPDISLDHSPTFGFFPPLGGSGWRFQYIPVHRSSFESETSDSFNIYRGGCQ